jgi:hypothetical protein
VRQIPAGDHRLASQSRGPIGNYAPVAVRKPLVGDHQIIDLRRETVLGVAERAGEIDDVATLTQDISPQLLERSLVLSQEDTHLITTHGSAERMRYHLRAENGRRCATIVSDRVNRTLKTMGPFGRAVASGSTL